MSTIMETMTILALTMAIVGQTVGRHEADLQYLCYAMNVFSQRLYQQIGLDNANIVFSPYSIHSALTLAYLGAGGETADEMARRLILGDMDPRPPYRNLTLDLLLQENVTVDISYAVVYRRHITLPSSYARDLQSVFWGTVATFGVTDTSLENAINGYMNEKTEKNIPVVLHPGRITPATTFLIVHLLFLKGNWKDQFSVEDTRNQLFTRSDGVRRLLPMMYSERYVDFKRDNKFRVDLVRLPLTGERFTLHIALPHANSGIQELEKQTRKLDAVEHMFDNYELKYIAVSFPKFRINTHLNLKEPIRRLGFLRTFTASHANFTVMYPEGNIYLTDVIHAAVIDVNEAGVSASSGNVISIAKRSVSEPQESFVADRPFLFFLRDNLRRDILFQGKFCM